MLGGADREKIILSEAVKYSTELRKSAGETMEALQKIVEKTAPYDPRIATSIKTGVREQPNKDTPNKDTPNKDAKKD
jgi:hypothetical protein